jgi:hypothetical protein
MPSMAAARRTRRRAVANTTVKRADTVKRAARGANSSVCHDDIDSDSDCADDSNSDGADDAFDDSDSDDSDIDGADDSDSDGADDEFATEPNDGALPRCITRWQPVGLRQQQRRPWCGPC